MMDLTDKQPLVDKGERKLKCVIIGDGGVGKTSLLVSYLINGFPNDYIPTTFDNYIVSVMVDNKPCTIEFCDTAGQDDFDSLRPLCYPNTDAFIVCFSVMSPTSFANVAQKWIPEIRQSGKKEVPVILVGTHCDQRTDVELLLKLAEKGQHPVTERRAEHLVKKIGGICYVETSSITQKNLKEVFDEAISSGIRPPTHSKLRRGDFTGCMCSLM